jgi:ABC-2 type transport system permease protein
LGGGKLSIGTPAGFLAAEFFSWVPVLLIVYAVINGTGAIAGEESAGTLDLLMAQPVTRREVVVEKVLAGAIGAGAIIAIGFLGFLVTVPPVPIDIALRDILVACVNLFPITLLFYALSFWLGVAAPNRGMAASIAVAVATASYFVDLVTNAVDALSWLEYATPFHYYGGGLPLVDGIVWWHFGLLTGVAVAMLVLAERAFERRDIATGGHEVDLLRMLRLAPRPEPSA